MKGGGWREKDKRKKQAMGIQSYRELEVWRLALTERISRMLSGLRKALEKRL